MKEIISEIEKIMKICSDKEMYNVAQYLKDAINYIENYEDINLYEIYKIRPGYPEEHIDFVHDTEKSVKIEIAKHKKLNRDNMSEFYYRIIEI